MQYHEGCDEDCTETECNKCLNFFGTLNQKTKKNEIKETSSFISTFPTFELVCFDYFKKEKISKKM